MNPVFRTSWIALAAGGALAAAPTAAAQTGADDDVVIVTGAAEPVQIDTIGHAITVIPGALIEAQGYSYVPDVIRQVPGAAVSQAGAPGSLTQVRIRGAEGNHTLVLLDGVDISSPDQGETDFSTLLTGDIERIEVLRGPQSGLYGSNALAGVVNLITRRDIDGGYRVLSAEGGSFDTLRATANVGYGNGDDYAALGAAALTSQGYDVSADLAAQGVPFVGVGGARGDREGNAMLAIHLRGGRRLSDSLRIDGFARYVDKTSDTDGQAFGFPVSGKTYDDASSTDHRQLLVGGAARLDLGGWETLASASHIEERRRSTRTDFPFVLGPPAPTLAQLAALPLIEGGADAGRTRLGLQSTFSFAAGQSLTGFAETRRETYDDPFTGRDESRTLNGIGLQYRGEFAGQFGVLATARSDANDDFGDAVTYSLAVSWNAPGLPLRPHASVGTGVTNPTFTEQFGFDPGSFIGNPDLRPEEATGWDVGLEVRPFGDAARFDLTYFESTLENEIVTVFLPSFETTPRNSAADSDRSGWELAFDLAPGDDVSIMGSWTELDASEPQGIEIRRPEQQGAIDASWRIHGGPLQLNLGVTYNGPMTDTDFASFSRVRVDPYTLVRLGASLKLADTVEIFGRIENALDEAYEEVIGFRGAPAAAYVGVRFREDASR